MNPKDWFKKKEVEVKEPPTRATVLFGLFTKWGKSFVYKDLVGLGSYTSHNLGFDRSYYVGNVNVEHKNHTILRIEKDWHYTDNGNKARAIIYDESYSDQLDEYILALREAIRDKEQAARDKAAKAEAQRIKEETQF